MFGRVLPCFYVFKGVAGGLRGARVRSSHAPRRRQQREPGQPGLRRTGRGVVCESWGSPRPGEDVPYRPFLKHSQGGYKLENPIPDTKRVLPMERADTFSSAEMNQFVSSPRR